VGGHRVVGHALPHERVALGKLIAALEDELRPGPAEEGCAARVSKVAGCVGKTCVCGVSGGGKD
jgi:hypothetical protein